MTPNEKNELLMLCLSKSRNISVDRAYELADMAIRGDYSGLDETVDDNEWEAFTYYREIVRRYQRSTITGNEYIRIEKRVS